MQRLMGDADNIGENLRSYVQAFSPAVRDIFESFEFYLQVDRLEKANLLYLITEKFSQIDLHPETVSNAEMGLVFEELIRKFAELSNETAGEHFTPREVIRLMVNLIFIEDDEALTQPGIVRSLYDPAAGTGGMLSVAEEHLVHHNPSARLVLSGQELNPESYAICKADMLIKGQDIKSICFGNTLSDDELPEEQFDYMLSNPPFGVEWKKIKKEVEREAELMGYSGRFGPGLPRVSDGSLLFLLHLISKMRPAKDGGCRFGIVLNGSPLFTGGAGSGESEIRRYVLENDLLEAIIDPGKQISDQYGSVQIITVDGKVISGRIVNLAGDSVRVQTNMLDPGALVGVDRKQIDVMLPSKTSMLPQGLLNTLYKDEVLDLMAYLLSRGDRDNPMFKQ